MAGPVPPKSERRNHHKHDAWKAGLRKSHSVALSAVAYSAWRRVNTREHGGFLLWAGTTGLNSYLTSVKSRPSRAMQVLPKQFDERDFVIMPPVPNGPHYTEEASARPHEHLVQPQPP